jgi:hypothetical protein
MKGAELMDMALSLSTGLQERERKLVTYWTLATHALPYVDTFPLLVLRGKMGTGKSETLKIIAKFAHKPYRFNLRGSTLPVIRDALDKCQDGTAIIEEADHAWKDGDSAFERLLSDRYQRDSAQAALKRQLGKQWVTDIKHTFGATVLHRRIPFNDAALDGRSIPILFRADNTRTYIEFSDTDPWIVEGSEAVSTVEFAPVEVEQLPTVAPRIFNTYKPLLAIALLCSDEAFPLLIQELLSLATSELKEAQSTEPDGLVLRAILDNLGRPPSFAYIRVKTLKDSIFQNDGISLQHRQIAGMARQLGFKTKNSHGVTVVVPTPATVLAACQECRYEDDEIIAELKQQVLGKTGG